MLLSGSIVFFNEGGNDKELLLDLEEDSEVLKEDYLIAEAECRRWSMMRTIVVKAIYVAISRH